MTLDIRTKQTPFRISLKRKEPMEVFVAITNKGDKSEKASLAIETGRTLSLDQSGLKNYHEWRMDNFEPGKTKELYIRLFTKPQTDVGENPFWLTLTEYHETWDLVRKKITLDESVLVQK